MNQQTRIIHMKNQGWYVETPSGTHGPMQSKQEANDMVVLLSRVSAAGSEIACTDQECL